MTVEAGRLAYDILLLDPQELLTTPSVFSYLDVHGQQQKLELKAGSLAYSICQTPIILEAASQIGITVHLADGSLQRIEGNVLDDDNSRHIFQRAGTVHHLVVSVSPNK